MSFFRKLFGGGSEPAKPASPARELDYKGYLIQATPYQDNGQWQTCGVVSREVDGQMKQQRFIRADRFPNQDGAADQAIAKGKQIIDQSGDRMFEG